MSDEEMENPVDNQMENPVDNQVENPVEMAEDESDEEEDENIIEYDMEDGNDDDDDDADEGQGEATVSNTPEEKPKIAKSHPQVFIPGVSTSEPIPGRNDLEFDESAYVLYHEAQSGFPCLSFDIMKEEIEVDVDRYPYSMAFVAGTQAPGNQTNHLMVIQMMNIHKLKQINNKDEDDDDDDDYLDDDEDDDDKQPRMKSVSIPVDGGINRVRQTIINEKTFTASWIETGTVVIHDVSLQKEEIRFGNKGKSTVEHKATKQFRGHRSEGFALDWSPTIPGRLLSGDCEKDIHLWEPANHSGGWNVDQRPLKGHTSSVEDIQWSPSEKNVFASCSSDKSIRIFDVRAPPQKANMITARDAHDADVNVINWNKNDPFLVSGGDDGFLKIWDLRQIKDKKTVATFKHHTAPITSVEWHPTDSSIFCASGADNQVTMWDLAVEKDSSDESGPDTGVPPQLLFIHLGQTDVKEVHWHPQYPGMLLSTAESGFNVFKTISV